MDPKINALLFEELDKEEDEITKKICKLTVSLAQDASTRGQPNIPESVSQVLNSKLAPIFKELEK